MTGKGTCFWNWYVEQLIDTCEMWNNHKIQLSGEKFQVFDILISLAADPLVMYLTSFKS